MFPNKDVQCHSPVPHEPPLFAGDVCSAFPLRENCRHAVTL